MPKIGQPREEKGLWALSELAKSIRERRENKSKRGIQEAQVKSQRMNAAAQLLFSIGQTVGEVQFGEKEQIKLLGEVVFGGIQGKGTKREQQELTKELFLKRQKQATKMEDTKQVNRIDLAKAKHTQTMLQIKKKLDAGEQKEAQRMAFDYLKTLSLEVEPGAGEVRKGKAIAAQIQDKEPPKGAERLEKTFGEAPKVNFFFKGAKLTERDLLNLVGTPQNFEEMQTAYEKIVELSEQNPNLRQKYEEIFFEEYPMLHDKLEFRSNSKE